MPDRQFEAVLERLDRIADELARLNRQAELGEGFQLMARELRNLNESLNALAYAISDELHQHFVPGRLGSPLDVLIDAAGVAVGVALWRRLDR